MKKKMYWGLAALIILLGTATVLVFQHESAELAQLERDTDESEQPRKLPQVTKLPPKVTKLPPVQQPAPPVRVHADGSVHEGQHHDPIETEPSREYTPSPIQIPAGITDPDIKAAWERLDYISKNIWEWGGVPSDETVHLINQLMPPPDGFSGPTGHSDSEDTINLLGRLDPNDPRAAEVMAAYLCEGRIMGNGPINALVKMGVPAVPYLIPYMLDETLMPALRSMPIEVLGRIAQNHREDLGGIVEHIIIPRLEAVLSEEKPDYDEGKGAREALARLK